MNAARGIVAEGGDVNLVSCAEYMHRNSPDGKLPVHQAYLAKLTTGAANLITEASVMQAARMIAAEWAKESAYVDAGGAMEMMRNFGTDAGIAAELLYTAARKLESLDVADDTSLDAAIDAYLPLLAAEKQTRPVRAPWNSLNAILRGGVLPGELTILAARPSVGKSAFALNWAWSVACSGKEAVFFSLEMGREQLLERLVSNAEGLDLGSFRYGLNDQEKARAQKSLAGLRGRPLYIVDDPKISVAEVRRRTRLVQRQDKNLGLVVVDYLQLMTPDDRKAQREQQVASMTRGLKLLAKTLGVPVLLLAQLNRKGEESGRDPILSDLRESGAIEQDADIVIFLHQARKRTWHPDEPVKFIVAKGRSSGVGRDSLIFRRRYQRFEESSDAVFAQAEREEYEQDHPWADNGQPGLL
ncbi:AAA family ATPase [Desulfovibrio sp. OttesenSCG-928-A18]|nr:AAA family ATPase [Desulfovibrio sp. OttesenSCG-928-A18]